MKSLSHNRFFFVSMSALLITAGSYDVEAKERKMYVIEAGDTPIAVAKKFDVSVEALLEFNNLEGRSAFRAGASITIPFPGEVSGKDYTVRPGDSIACIADHFGVSQDDLRRANGLGDKNVLRAGQELKIPEVLRGGATRSHEVKRGDTLSAVAQKYKVELTALVQVNKIDDGEPLRPGRVLIIPDAPTDVPKRYSPADESGQIKSGRKVKGGVRHLVQPGQNLWIIAKAYDVDPDDIARANRRSKTDPLSVGESLFIPGAEDPVPVQAEGTATGAVRFVRVWNDEKLTLSLFDSRGRLNQKARAELSELAAPRHETRRKKLLHPRLLFMIQRVADRFPGRTIEVISGYRPGETGSESRHSQGRALDFRVSAVPNREVYDFIKSLPKVGAGYYPNSVFVHLDVRDRRALWTDLSRPGEDPEYKNARYAQSKNKNNRSKRR